VSRVDLAPVPCMPSKGAGLRGLWHVALMLVLPLTGACETRDALTLLGGCLAPGVDRAMKQDGEVDVQCDLKKSVWLIAVPAGDLREEQLTQTGISDRDVTALLNSSHLKGDRWCTVELLSSSQTGERPSTPADVPVGKAECVTANVHISALEQVRAKSIVVTLKRSTATAVEVVRVKSSSP
jgi:hypothetical protein